MSRLTELLNTAQGPGLQLFLRDKVYGFNLKSENLRYEIRDLKTIKMNDFM